MCEIVAPQIVAFFLSKRESIILKETIYANDDYSIKKRL